MAYTNILPDTAHPINQAGQAAGAVYGPGFSGVKLSSEEKIQSFLSNSMRSTKNAGHHHIWKIEISYNPLECDEFHRVYTFVLDKLNTLTPFYIAIPPYSSQTLTGITLEGNHSEGDRAILVDGTGVSVGDIFSYNDKVYQVVRLETEFLFDTTTPGVGKERLYITPPLKQDILDNQVLDFNDPLFKVFPASGALNYTLDKDGLFNFSLSLEEVFK